MKLLNAPPHRVAARHRASIRSACNGNVGVEEPVEATAVNASAALAHPDDGQVDDASDMNMVVSHDDGELRGPKVERRRPCAPLRCGGHLDLHVRDGAQSAELPPHVAATPVDQDLAVRLCPARELVTARDAALPEH